MHLACIYIAAKNVEFVPYKKLLSTMLSHVHNQEVDANVAANLELEVSVRARAPAHAHTWHVGASVERRRRPAVRAQAGCHAVGASTKAVCEGCAGTCAGAASPAVAPGAVLPASRHGLREGGPPKGGAAGAGTPSPRRPQHVPPRPHTSSSQRPLRPQLGDPFRCR